MTMKVPPFTELMTQCHAEEYTRICTTNVHFVFTAIAKQSSIMHQALLLFHLMLSCVRVFYGEV